MERFLGERRIAGVVLVGGDSHASRHLRYPDRAARVGYPLDQWIVSPQHDSTSPSPDVPHPGLRRSAVAPRTFLVVTAAATGAEPLLTAVWVQDHGQGAGRELHRAEYRHAARTAR